MTQGASSTSVSVLLKFLLKRTLTQESLPEMHELDIHPLCIECLKWIPIFLRSGTMTPLPEPFTAQCSAPPCKHIDKAQASNSPETQMTYISIFMTFPSSGYKYLHILVYLRLSHSDHTFTRYHIEEPMVDSFNYIISHRLQSISCVHSLTANLLLD